MGYLRSQPASQVLCSRAASGARRSPRRRRTGSVWRRRWQGFWRRPTRRSRWIGFARLSASYAGRSCAGGIWMRTLRTNCGRHIELAAAENERSGMSPEEARRAALRAFGRRHANPRSLSRAARIFWAGPIARDARFAWQSAAPFPGVRADVDFHAGPGHRGGHRDLQRCRRGSPAAVRIPRSGSAGGAAGSGGKRELDATRSRTITGMSCA